MEIGQKVRILRDCSVEYSNSKKPARKKIWFNDPKPRIVFITGIVKKALGEYSPAGGS